MMNNFENHIKTYLDKYPKCQISEAMMYALEGGKRFRPRIIFAIMKGFSLPEEKAYDAAMALEFIQTYSLIHDDLPAMDNDDMRRGKPSLHKAFREDIAILAGDELLNDSFRIIAESTSYDDQTKAKLIAALSKYSGIDGMIYGQLLDVTADPEKIDKEALYTIHEHKTGGLFKISCLMPMYIAGIDREEYYIGLGSKIGHIFQNQDDLFDLIKTEAEMGKNLSDAEHDKATALSVYTPDELKQLISDEFSELELYLQSADFETAELLKLLQALKER